MGNLRSFLRKSLWNSKFCVLLIKYFSQGSWFFSFCKWVSGKQQWPQPIVTFKWFQVNRCRNAKFGGTLWTCFVVPSTWGSRKRRRKSPWRTMTWICPHKIIKRSSLAMEMPVILTPTRLNCGKWHWSWSLILLWEHWLFFNVLKWRLLLLGPMSLATTTLHCQSTSAFSKKMV